ncbi:MAG: linear amide C-N hydrolase [Spirochaetes bacterium]|nr:linear amide C-N hydrolase [Spirochaetota bacterium]
MCTLFVATSEERAFACLNLDWHGNPAGTLHFRKAAGGGYGIMVTSLFGRRLPFEGMNEAGLYIGQTAVPRTKRKFSATRPYFSTSIIPRILARCGCADEAIREIEARSVFFGSAVGLNMFHFMVADASGASAVIEFIEDTIVIRKEGPFQLMTNFYLSDPSIRWKNHVEGCGGYERFSIAECMLRSMGHPTVESCAEVCRAAAMHDFHYEGKTMNTLWTGIYDLARKSARFYLRKNYESHYDIDLQKELSLGNGRILMERSERKSRCFTPFSRTMA